MARTTLQPSSAVLRTFKRVGGDFLSWWGRELAAWVPERVRAWLRGSHRIVLLTLDGTRAVFNHPGSSDTQGEFELGPAGPGLHSDEMRRKLLQVAGRKFRLLLALPTGQVLRRTISLPLAVEENLRQVLAFELDRYTPFRSDQVYFDFRVLERDIARKQLTVELAAVPRTVVDQGVARATALGLVLDGAVLADAAAVQSGEYLDFLPADGRRPKSVKSLWWRGGMAAVSLVLLAILLAVPLWQKRSAAIALLQPMAQSAAAAQETDALRDRLQKMVEEQNFLHKTKWEAPSALLVLEELSKLLPDDTFVMQFDFDGNSVQIRGETASSTSLLETLEASPVFKDVGFKSQLIKLQGTRNDRFHVSATLEPGSIPKAPPGPQPKDAPPGAPAASAHAASVTSAPVGPAESSTAKSAQQARLGTPRTEAHER